MKNLREKFSYDISLLQNNINTRYHLDKVDKKLFYENISIDLYIQIWSKMSVPLCRQLRSEINK